MSAPIFSRPRFLPGSKINGAQIDHAVISDGCIINHAHIGHSIVGLRSIVGDGHRPEPRRRPGLRLLRVPRIHRRARTRRPAAHRHRRATASIENAIIDKNARIGDNVVISPAGKPDNVDHPLYYIRDGIVIIPKNGILPNGTVI